MLKLDVKTKTASGVEFSSGGSSVLDTGKVNNAFLKIILGVGAGSSQESRDGFQVKVCGTFSR